MEVGVISCLKNDAASGLTIPEGVVRGQGRPVEDFGVAFPRYRVLLAECLLLDMDRVALTATINRNAIS